MRWYVKLPIILVCLALIGGSAGYLMFWYYFEHKTDDLPNIEALRNYNFNLSTIVRGDKGEVIDKFAVEDRIFLPFDSIPKNVINAVTAAEDKDFWSNRLVPGIDHVGVIRAAWMNIKAGKIVAGGSTITQQTAKQVWLNDERSFPRKFKEARLAYRMEKEFSKKLIFELYINLVYFGHDKYGIFTASEFYFGKTPEQLSIDEAAMLAGLVKWPHRFSPIARPKAALNRRNTILERMKNNGFITVEELQELKAKSLSLNVKKTHPEAPYLSSFIMNKLHELGYEKIVNQGLDIRTSINSQIQAIAAGALENGLKAYEKRHEKRLVLYNIFSDYELKSLDDFKSDTWNSEIGLESVVDGLVIEIYENKAVVKIGSEKAIITDNVMGFETGDVLMLKITGVNRENDFTVEILQPKIQGAVVVLDVETGGIKAMIGGRDFKTSEYNRAMQAKRQAGSAFKPFVYGTLFEMFPNKDLNSIVLDQNPPNCYKTGNPAEPRWCPQNYEEKSLPKFMGPISIKTAIARSRNVAAVRVANDIGINNIVDLANKLGITNNLPRYLPTAIGAADVKVIDMARAFSAFFRNGIDKPYWFLERIKKGNESRDVVPRNEKQILSPEAANKVLEGMRWVVLAGTARSATKDLSFPIACKTGTTDKFTDAWILCGTPKYIIAVWVGFDRKAIPLVSRESSAKETGGFTAAPITAEILREIYKDRPHDLFSEEMENKILGIKKPEPEKIITPE